MGHFGGIVTTFVHERGSKIGLNDYISSILHDTSFDAFTLVESNLTFRGYF